ncbi:MAG: potassium transporter Kup [Deltaproteobacteria bacterium]|nr:potassium transporter Kup [Deltaproteobacteria bacterium]
MADTKSIDGAAAATARRAPRPAAPAPGHGGTVASLPLMALGALGIVYGDIGTSPLYALRSCFVGDRALAPTPDNVLGILSLVVWALIVVVSVKYLATMLRADNRGEGGILALLALAGRRRHPDRAARGAQTAALGILGAALLYGDGVITPAISVLSAMEGLKVVTTKAEPFVVPLTVAILAGLFAVQRRGTARVASVFGPAMLVWFAVIGALGANAVLHEQPGHPSVWSALDPRTPVAFIAAEGATSFFVLGSVVLVVTGAEALYADLGHFGARPIRTAWYLAVFPALVLNYMGQAVLMLEGGSAARHPFFDLAPSWGLLPLVGLSTVATVIASQALISGAFSLTRQAIVLGYLPPTRVVHTSEKEPGQIYVPQVNWALMVLCILMVLFFRSSNALGDAYGVAVTGTMTITSLLFFRVARNDWRWAWPLAAGVTAFFLVFDLTFLSANLAKVLTGGWVPLLIAAVVFTIMTTWKRGRSELVTLLGRIEQPVHEFLAEMHALSPVVVPGTVVYLAANTSTIPRPLQRNLHINHVRHERIVILAIDGATDPFLDDEDRVTVLDLGDQIYRMVALFGFMEQPGVERVFACAAQRGLVVETSRTDFYVQQDVLAPTGNLPMARWRKRLFTLLVRLSRPMLGPSGLPAQRVILVGQEIEM